MRNRTLKNVIWIIFAVASFVIFIILDYRHLNRLQDKYRSLTISDSLYGRVVSVEHYRNTPGVSYVVINSEKILIGASSNEMYEVSNINRIMVPGDSIAKGAGSDSIYLFHEEMKYSFVLNKVINKKTILNR